MVKSNSKLQPNAVKNPTFSFTYTEERNKRFSKVMEIVEQEARFRPSRAQAFDRLIDYFLEQKS